MVDKNRLVAALLLKNDSSAHHCSWGQQLDKEVLHSIEIPELGNLHVPLAIEVCFVSPAIIINLKNHFH